MDEMILGLKCPMQPAGLWPLMWVNSDFSLFQTYPLYSYWSGFIGKTVWWMSIFSQIFFTPKNIHTTLFCIKEHSSPRWELQYVACQYHLHVWSRCLLSPCAKCSQNQKKKKEGLKCFQKKLIKWISLACQKVLDNIWKRS